MIFGSKSRSTSRRLLELASSPGGHDELVEMLIAMTESDRRDLWPSLEDEIKPNAFHPVDSDATAAGRSILLNATATAAVIKRSWSTSADHHPRLWEVVAARPARIRDAIVAGELDREWHANWKLVRDLVRNGVIDHPDSEGYYRGLVLAAPCGRWEHESQEWVTSSDDVDALLRRDLETPGEVLRAFEFEEPVKILSEKPHREVWPSALLTAIDDGLFERAALLDQAIAGQLRDFRKSSIGFFRTLLKALDPTVDELAERSNDLIRVVSASHPTEQAGAARLLIRVVDSGTAIDGSAAAAAVLTPLSGTQKNAAAQAMRLLERLDIADAEKARAAVSGLGHGHTDIQQAAVELLSEMGDALPADVVADIALWADSVAPVHRRPLLDLIGGDQAEVEVEVEGGDAAGSTPGAAVDPNADPVDDLADIDLASFEHSNIAAAIGDARSGVVPPPLTFDPYALATPGDPLLPLASPDEVVARLIEALAGSASALDLELVIDGLARFRAADASPALRSSLEASISNDTTWFPVGRYLQEAAGWWLKRRLPDPPSYLSPNGGGLSRLWRRGPELAHDLVAPSARTDAYGTAFDQSMEAAGSLGMIRARIWEAVAISDDRPQPTFALPSTTDGWLEIDELTRRLDAWGDEPVLRFDITQALFRLRPPAAPMVGANVGASSGNGNDPIHHPTIAEAVNRLVAGSGPTADDGLNRATDAMPWLSGFNLVKMPADRGLPSGHILRFTIDENVPRQRRDDPASQLLDDLVLSRARHTGSEAWSGTGAFFTGDDVVTDWMMIGLPRHRPLVTARMAMSAAGDLDANRATDTVHRLCSALAARPDEPLDLGGHSLLAVGLADRNVVTSGAAGDLFVECALDGRLDPALLGAILSDLHARDLVKGARFAQSLTVAAEVSPLTAERLRQVIVRWLAGLSGPAGLTGPVDIPRDLHAVLETLELACAAAGIGIDDATARAVLGEASNGSSKRAKSARRLLELDVGPPAGSPAAAEALQHLAARARRWSEHSAR